MELPFGRTRKRLRELQARVEDLEQQVQVPDPPGRLTLFWGDGRNIGRQVQALKDKLYAVCEALGVETTFMPEGYTAKQKRKRSRK